MKIGSGLGVILEKGDDIFCKRQDYFLLEFGGLIFMKLREKLGIKGMSFRPFRAGVVGELLFTGVVHLICDGKIRQTDSFIRLIALNNNACVMEVILRLVACSQKLKPICRCLFWT